MEFVGEFRGGKANGPGERIWVDGKKLVGEFVDGELVGGATVTWGDGTIYTGQVKNNKPHGKGVLTTFN